MEDKQITCDLARQWLRLNKSQKLAKLNAKVVVDAVVACATSNVLAPPPPKICLSPTKVPLPCTTAPKLQGLGDLDLNIDAIVEDDDHCIEPNCDDVDKNFHRDPHQEHAAGDGRCVCGPPSTLELHAEGR